MTTLTMKVPEDLERTLTEMATMRGVSRSLLIRELLQASLRNVQDRGTVSCLDVARDLAGSVEGPSDLSTSARHMKGFGR